MPPNTTTPTRNSSTTESPLPSRPRYIFLGDSITEQGGFNGGFTDILKKTYITYIDVVNLAESGVNTNVTLEKTIPRIASELQASPTPTLIAVWLGNNDASLLGGQYAEKHIPVDDYKSNLVKMLVKLRELAPVAKLVLLTALVNDDEMRRARLSSQGAITNPLDRTNQQAGVYAAACRQVGAAKANMDVHVLDMYKYFMETYPNTADRAKMLSDGMHLSLDGHRVAAEQLATFFLTLIPSAYPLTTPPPQP